MSTHLLTLTLRSHPVPPDPSRAAILSPRSLAERRSIGGSWMCLLHREGRRGTRCAAASSASRGKPPVFHDHEDFCVLCHIKVFAIMEYPILANLQPPRLSITTALAYHGKHEHQEPPGEPASAPEQPESAQRPPVPGLVTNRKGSPDDNHPANHPHPPKPGDPTPAAATYRYQEGHNSREGFRS